jgi:hypothetical protein
VPDVKWLFETQSNRGAYIVSTSKPIPAGMSAVLPNPEIA